MFLCSFVIDDLIHDYSEKMKANFFSQLINNVHSSTYLSIFYLFSFGSIHSIFSPDTKSRFYLLLKALYSLFTVTYYFLLLSGKKNLTLAIMPSIVTCILAGHHKPTIHVFFKHTSIHTKVLLGQSPLPGTIIYITCFLYPSFFNVLFCFLFLITSSSSHSHSPLIPWLQEFLRNNVNTTILIPLNGPSPHAAWVHSSILNIINAQNTLQNSWSLFWLKPISLCVYPLTSMSPFWA